MATRVDEKSNHMTRRNFLLIGWSAFASFLASSFLGTVRFFFPNVLFEPPSRFKIGQPEDYAEDSVTFLSDRKVYLFHAPEGFYAISGVCTHLGCTTNWDPDSRGFRCPCHGSRFDRAGSVIKGPAPKPLKWVEVSLGLDGRLVVDVAKTVSPDFILRV